MKRNDFKENKKRGASEVASSTKLPPVNSKQAVPANFTLNAVSQQDEGLISILHEYFIKNNYLETLESFQKDCCKPMKLNSKNQDEIKKDLLTVWRLLFSCSTKEWEISSFWSLHSSCRCRWGPRTFRPWGLSFTCNFTFTSTVFIPSSARRKVSTMPQSNISLPIWKVEDQRSPNLQSFSSTVPLPTCRSL